MDLHDGKIPKHSLPVKIDVQMRVKEEFRYASSVFDGGSQLTSVELLVIAMKPTATTCSEFVCVSIRLHIHVNHS